MVNLFLIKLVYLLILVDIILFFFNFFLFKFFFLIIFFALTSYWMLSIFMFLYNTSRLSKYTTVISGFWRRSFALFWVIEGFLFSIYIFLVLNCSIEIEWLSDQKQLFQNNDLLSIFFFNDIFNNIVLIALLYILTKNFIFSKRLLSIVILIVLLLVSIRIFWNEFLQFFLYSQYFNFYTLSFDKSVNVWVYSTSLIPFKVISQWLFLLIFLKFWHTIFIFMVFFINIRLFYNNMLYSNSSFFKISLYNFLIFMIFGFLMFVFFIKIYMNYSYSYIFYWFYFNNFSLEDFFLKFIGVSTKLLNGIFF
jgi:hypothetical protein